MELIVPKGGAWYLVWGARFLAEDASGAFTLQMETVTVTPTMNRRHVQSLSGPGQGAGSLDPSQRGTPSVGEFPRLEGSETQPVARRYFTGKQMEKPTWWTQVCFRTRIDGIIAQRVNWTRFGEQSTLTGQSLPADLDAQLRGGENSTMSLSSSLPVPMVGQPVKIWRDCPSVFRGMSWERSVSLDNSLMRGTTIWAA